MREIEPNGGVRPGGQGQGIRAITPEEGVGGGRGGVTGIWYSQVSSSILFSPLILCFSVHSSRGRETRILQTISFSVHSSRGRETRILQTISFPVHSSRGRETRILQTISFSKHILNMRWNAATIFKPGSTLKRRKALGFDFSSLTHVNLYK